MTTRTRAAFRRRGMLVATLGGGLSLLLTSCGDAGSSNDGSGELPDEITLIVPRSPGGGYDVYGRGFADILERHLPDGTVVVVENITGAGGQVAASDLMAAEPDGSTLMISDPEGLLSFEMVEETDYSVEEFTTFGTATVRPSTFAVSMDSPWRTFDDFREAARAGSLSYATTDTTSPVFIEAMLALVHEEVQAEPPTVVPHGGSPEAFTSVIRGDTDFIAFSIDSVAPYIDDGELRAIIHFSEEPMTDIIGDVPIGADYGLAELDGALQTSLTLFGPPGMPADIEDSLREAIEEALFSEEFAAWGEEDGRIVNPIDTDATLDRIAERKALYEANIELLREYLG